ncbi:MAG: hypothetical protein K8T10_13210 [Candidatus Eremiobacteraeota bacterium]|nr:hypothetical protein [Candidatus Eremiobacteraeota bacterium]
MTDKKYFPDYYLPRDYDDQLAEFLAGPTQKTGKKNAVGMLISGNVIPFPNS